MSVVGWILFVVMLLWYIRSMWFSHSRRRHLRDYIIYLLLDDEIRNHYKQDLEKWIRQVDVQDAMSLGIRAHNAIENMAERLAIGDTADTRTSSVLGAHAMLWSVKQGSNVN